MGLEYTSNVLCGHALVFFYRWLAIRLEFVGNLVIFFTALLAAIQIDYQNELRIRINPGLVGVSISCALQVRNASLKLLCLSIQKWNIFPAERSLLH